MNRSAIYRATNADPAFATELDIATVVEMTKKGPGVCDDIVSYLAHRLSKEDPQIKIKCLKLIKHLCRRGRAEFRVLAQREMADTIRTLQSYKTPNCLGGEMPPCDKGIRTSARDCLEALFEADNQSRDAVFSPSRDANSLDDTPGHTHPTFGGPKKMVGFGNTPDLPRSEELLKSTSLMSLLGNLSRKLPASVSSAFGFSQGSLVNDSFSTYAENPNKSMSQTSNFDAQIPIDGEWTKEARPNAGSACQQADIEFNLRYPNTRLPTSSPMYCQEAGTYETRLVERIVEPGGSRVAPQPRMLHEFCRRCTMVDMDVVLLVLIPKLEGCPWQQTLRCLFLLEALLKRDDLVTDGLPLSQRTKDFFKSHSAQSQILRRLTKNDSAPCAIMAKEVLSLLDEHLDVAPPKLNAHQLVSISLLDGLDDDGGDDDLEDGDEQSQVDPKCYENEQAESAEEIDLLAQDLDDAARGKPYKETVALSKFPFIHAARTNPSSDMIDV